MKYRLPLFALLTMTSAVSCLQAQDSAPVDVRAVLTTLNTLKKKQKDTIKSTETGLAQQLMAKAGSPSDAIAYYMDAVYETQFVGQSKEGTEFQGWKKRHEAEFKDPNFKDALCLHLMYLSLAISHDAGVKTKDLLSYLLTYVQQVRSDQDNLWSQELMTQALNKSIFVHWLQIDQYLSDTDKWEPVPINIDGIYGKTILPEYRTTKNATAIFQYWDDRLAREEEGASRSKRTFDMDKFNTTTKPALLWLRANEYVELGLRNKAINEMLAVIKTYPYHADNSSWIEQLKAYITPPDAPAQAPVVTATPEPTPTPATPAPTVPPDAPLEQAGQSQ